MWGALSDEMTGPSFTAIIVSGTCHLYLQFYMSAFYTVSCKESGSLLIHTIYSFTCSTNVQYIEGHSKSRLGTADHALTHVVLVTTAA
jgi:hypothetical protein